MSPIKNVIFIMLDTLQFNYLGCYGNTNVKTPNLDRFARQGFLFENAYSEGLPTIPVRRAIMTGRFTLPYAGWKPLDLNDTSLTDMLWCREVQTALVYDTPPMRLPKYGYSRGFDYVKFCNGHELDHETFHNVPLDPAVKAEDYLSPGMLHRNEDGEYDSSSQSLIREAECYLKQRQFWKSDADNYVSVVAREADDWLRRKRDPKRPFLMWVDSFDPHEPWDPPSVWEGKPCPHDPDYQGNPMILAPWTEVKGVMTEEECAHIRALYMEKVELVDKWIGNLLDSIREQGLWDETMVIITSDHGQPMGNGEHGHGIMRKCRPWPYEELVHVPLLIHVPGLEGGKRIESFVQNVDVTATMMDALGYGQSALSEAGHEGIQTYGADEMHGISLLPVMRGETDTVREVAIAGYYGMSWSLITKDWSYIHWLKNDIDTDEMNRLFYDGSGKGGNAGRQSAELEMKEEMWTCVQGAEVTVPEQDELYDRRADPFQLNNLAGEHPEKAKELLTEAGYPNGFDMTITVPSNYQSHMDTAQVIVEQLKAVGINATIQPVTWESWVQDTYSNRQFQSTVVGVDASNMTARAMLERFVSTASRDFINYNNADYDALFAQAQACYDDGEQTALYRAMEKNLAENAANVYIQDMADFVAVRDGLEGPSFYPIYVLDLSTIHYTK